MKNAVTEKLISTVKRKVKPTPGKGEIDFLRSFYHRLSGQDFVAHKAAEFRAAALRHRRLGRVRAPGETLIEVYNPGGSGGTGGTGGTGSRARSADGVDDRDATIINLITDDKPFIIDSLVIQLNAMRKTPHRTAHPNFEVQRDRQHRLVKMSRYRGRRESAAGAVESFVQFVIDFTPKAEHSGLLQALHGVMADLEIVVKDWKKMRANALALAERLEDRKQGPAFAEHGELLRWLENHNFAFLGFAEMEVVAGGTAGAAAVVVDGKSALGVPRAAWRRGGQSAVMDILPPPAFSKTSPVVFTKSRQRSTVHRANYFDCILIDHAFHRGPAHRPRRVSCILGFLAGASAMLPTSAIPHLRNKTAYILKESTLRPGGYAYKSLQSILETLPREKLFQMDTRSLYGLCMTILNHLERRKTRVHLHRNLCGHFYSCLVYIPRDLFNSTLRQRIQRFLGRELDADEVSFTAYFSDSILTRIHYLIHRRDPSPDKGKGKTDPAQLEGAIQAMARDWNDNLHEAIRQQSGYETANRALALYRDAFPASYRDEFSVTQGMIDIDRFAQVAPGGIHGALTRREPGDSAPDLRRASFKLYSGDSAIALSDVLPILENMGIRVLGERPYDFLRRDGVPCRLHDFEIERQDQAELSITDADNFQSTFARAWSGGIENDGFNQLTLLAGLNWKEISLLRAYYRYLKQIRLRYSEQYIIEALANSPKLVVSIVRLFDARFNPALARKGAGSGSGSGPGSGPGLQGLKAAIARQLDQVATLDEDRILRALLDVIDATLRTNYYQRNASGNGGSANGNSGNGDSKPYLALKLNSAAIPRIPAPAPRYDIFVCSPRVEGVHLRGGKIARGGLRWSERPEDFRTEVLGLVKAQRVKNAVIVPVGSKGGFVAKQLPESGRDEIQREVVACYRLFISGLLDLTDNLAGGKVVPPADVVRADDDDPYLVVAADKGTATFSDIANGLSGDYGFWLGDAFASGGSAGYDHKKMGITARGAWESVKRHFRELGKDIQCADFTVVGIGDMAGDVFGNGMLLSKHIRLLAAFNHRHIFIDPSPDAARSYRERRRLFNLPRSSWADYDRDLISRGGGVYERSAKSIALSPQAKNALGASRDRYAPDDLIHLILQAEVELLWNGGIGTYVKATAESDSAAQDKNNDGLRVDAGQLRCKVIGEGGNLGMTQLARMEYARAGGLCYTDAIDNSAGVDTSDHEVNIKILLNAAIQDGLLRPQQRNALLAKMEAEVGALVLRNNYVQTQAISLEAARGDHRLMLQQTRAIDALEQKGLLNREIEFLPARAALEERREEGHWLTRPELAVLLSYSKMDLCQALLDSDLPDDAYLAAEIDRYFPPRLAKKYPAPVRAHRLRREIISTQITNDLVGVMGPNFHLRLADLVGGEPAEITRAYIAARDLLDIPKIRAAIEALDNRVGAGVQMEMLAQTAATLHLCIAWLLRTQSSPLNIGNLMAAFRPGCDAVKDALEKTLGRNALAAMEAQRKQLAADGVPVALAGQIAALPPLGYAVDIVDLAARGKRSVRQVAEVYFQVRETLGLDWIERAIDALPASNDWHERARFSLANDLRASHTTIASKVLSGKSKATTGAMLDRWLKANRPLIHAIDQMSAALKAEHTPDFAMLSVLVSELAWLH